MWISNKVCSAEHDKEEKDIKDFILFSKDYKQKNNKKHLNSNKHVLSIKAEWIILEYAVACGQNVCAQLKL